MPRLSILSAYSGDVLTIGTESEAGRTEDLLADGEIGDVFPSDSISPEK